MDSFRLLTSWILFWWHWLYDGSRYRGSSVVDGPWNRTAMLGCKPSLLSPSQRHADKRIRTWGIATGAWSWGYRSNGPCRPCWSWPLRPSADRSNRRWWTGCPDPRWISPVCGTWLGHLQRLHTELCIQTAGRLPGQNLATVLIHDRLEVSADLPNYR